MTIVNHAKCHICTPGGFGEAKAKDFCNSTQKEVSFTIQICASELQYSCICLAQLSGTVMQFMYLHTLRSIERFREQRASFAVMGILLFLTGIFTKHKIFRAYTMSASPK